MIIQEDFAETDVRGQTTLLLHATSGTMTPEALRPGRDAVLNLPLEHGCRLPRGVLVDDHLALADRESVDRAAQAAIGRWRSLVDETLIVEGICLADVWHSELFAEVFLPTTRTVAAIRATVDALETQRVLCHGLDPDLVAALAEELDAVEVRVSVPGPRPRYPGEDAAPVGIRARQPLWQRVGRRTLDLTGAPSLPRGEVFLFPYLTTLSVLERLADGAGPRPVLYSGAIPSMQVALRAVRRGGWVGLPGLRARHQARRSAVQRIAQAERLAPGGTGLDHLLHVRALDCLSARSPDTTSVVAGLRRLFGRRHVRVVVLPFDHEPLPKTIVRVAQQAGVPTVAVQHGYEPYRVFPTGAIADFVAVWSTIDRDAFAPKRRASVRVVGNPRKTALVSAAKLSQASPDRSTRTAVVLVEHHMRQSTLLDRRITARHLEDAVAGLRRSQGEWRIVIRPHPIDNVTQFERMAQQFDGVDVDAVSPAAELLGRADLCVGALSTATLEAALLGARVVMLNSSGISWAPPLQVGGEVPMASNASELARVVDQVMEAAEAPGRRALLEGLGVLPEDPAGALIEWLSEIASHH